MNGFWAFPPQGPTVPGLSQQVRAYGPRWSPPKKRRPIGDTPLKGVAWAVSGNGPMEHIEPKNDTKDERVVE